MATQPVPVPISPQFGVGLFEAGQTFQGLASYRWSYPTALAPVWGILDAGTGAAAGASLGTSAGGVILPPGYITAAGEQGLANATQGMSHTQHARTVPMIQHAQVLEGLGAAIEAGAAYGLDTRKTITRKVSPRTIIRYVKPNLKGALAPLTRRANEADARAKLAAKEQAQLAARVKHIEKQLHTVGGIALPGIERDFDWLKRRQRGIEKQLGKLGKLAGLGAFLLLLSKALEKIGAQFIRCSNVKKWGKSMCGMNQNLLESLLADALLIASLISIVEFAKELQGIEAEVAKGIRYGVKELKPGFVPVAGKLH